MPSLTPHINFFGQLVDAHMELDFLSEFATTIDSLLQDAAKSASSTSPLSDSIAAVAEDRAELYAELFPPLVHEAFLISAAIFIEREMRTYVDILRSALDSKLSFNDLNGSAIDRFRIYTEKVCSLNLGLSNSHWQDLDGLFAIRNCLVHSFGNMEHFRQKPAISAFIKRHGAPALDHDRIKLSAKTSQTVLSLLREVVERIYRSALARFPEKK